MIIQKYIKLIKLKNYIKLYKIKTILLLNSEKYFFKEYSKSLVY